MLAQPIFGQAPCESAVHDQFDFWVGDWQVFKTGTDTIVGQNQINRILNGCVVEENWTGANGSAGKSFNTYNAQDSTWNQVWVDGGGNTYHFKGHFKDNVMQMLGDTTDGQGRPIHFDMSYTFDPKKETVRQVWKLSTDAGANWQVIFDGTYKKKT